MGILMLGKISVGIDSMEKMPRIRIKNAKTTKVYGRLSASRTIHIIGLVLAPEPGRSGQGRSTPDQGSWNERWPIRERSDPTAGPPGSFQNPSESTMVDEDRGLADDLTEGFFSYV